jgi:serine/threonine protein kinase
MIQAVLIGDSIPPSDAPADRPAPTLPSDYEIVRELGRGGMGVVYLARQKSLGRDVAVKVLRPGEATFGRVVKRFLEEARHLARLRHPNIVSIHEIGQADNEPYFTMDYVNGEPLSRILARSARSKSPTEEPIATAETESYANVAHSATARSSTVVAGGLKSAKRLSPTQALAILKQAAAAVQHAHEHGIIHRDLKPGNVLIDASGHAYVTDFGLACDLAQSSKLTRSGQVMGTPAYMSPEQARGQKELIGEATDVHALGVILYEMLTGQLPYGNDAPASVIVRLLTDEPIPPRRIDRRIPRDLETICLKAMAKTPERRYASVRAFLEDIRRFESGESVLARRPGPFARSMRFARRHWKLGAAVAATAAMVLATTLALAPRWFDKSVDELIKWGNEEFSSGHNEVGLQAYVRAYRNAPPDKRPRILELMLNCARGVKESQKAGSILSEVLDVDPDVSFQEFDYWVADAKVDRRRYEDLGGLKPEEKRRFLELAEKRFMLVASGSYGTPTQKQDAAKFLTDVRRQLAALKTVPDLVLEFPSGDPDKLLRSAADPKSFEWNRGSKAFAAGVELERTGNVDAALKAYRQAYDLMRRAFPTYAGNLSNYTQHRKVDSNSEMKECRMLRLVQQSIRRLDPATPDTLRGGIRFKIVGVEISRTILSYLNVTLYDPSLSNPVYFPTPNGVCPLQIDQTAWLGVADGKYSLVVRWSGVDNPDPTERYDGKSIGAGIELDLDDVPREVEIAGDTKEITLHAYSLATIASLNPTDGESVDLRKDAFHWTSLPNAKTYQLEFSSVEPIPNGERSLRLLMTESASTSLSLTSLREADAKKLAPLTSGRTGSWLVVAYDAKGRCIGRTIGDGNFKVTHGLNEP